MLVWLCWVFVVARGLSRVAAGGGCSLAAVRRLLSVGASLVEEHRPRTRGLLELLCGMWILSGAGI